MATALGVVAAPLAPVSGCYLEPTLAIARDVGIPKTRLLAGHRINSVRSGRSCVGNRPTASVRGRAPFPFRSRNWEPALPLLTQSICSMQSVTSIGALKAAERIRSIGLTRFIRSNGLGRKGGGAPLAACVLGWDAVFLAGISWMAARRRHAIPLIGAGVDGATFGEAESKNSIYASSLPRGDGGTTRANDVSDDNDSDEAIVDVEVESTNLSIVGGGKAKNPVSDERLQRLISVIADDFPAGYERELNWSVYANDVIFVDPVVLIKGLLQYQGMYVVLRLMAWAWFEPGTAIFEVTGIEEVDPLATTKGAYKHREYDETLNPKRAIGMTWRTEGTSRWGTRADFSGDDVFRIGEDGMIISHESAWNEDPGAVWREVFLKEKRKSPSPATTTNGYNG